MKTERKHITQSNKDIRNNIVFIRKCKIRKRQWYVVFKVLKDLKKKKNYLPREKYILQIKIFLKKQNGNQENSRVAYMDHKKR